MTYVLNNADVLPVPASARTVTSASSARGFWQRLYAGVLESRRRSAARELRARSYLIGESEIVLGDYAQMTLRTDVELPFHR